jgi:TRAP transporter T-component
MASITLRRRTQAQMIRSLFALLFIIPLSGCSIIVASATEPFATDLSASILEQNDPETVEAGMPAYLLLIDGLIRDNPKSEDLLLSGAKLYSAYAGVFVKDAERAQRLTVKAREYATRALCQHRTKMCDLAARPFDEYRAALATLGRADVPSLYTFSATWAGWTQAHSNDWNAVADLAKVRAGMERVIELDEAHEHGGAHLYLGVLTSLLPSALGGKPEEGRRHFERAIVLSQGRDLMAKVEYARRYARLVFDRPLHDRLLNEVLQAPVSAPGLTLSNTLAQRAARDLLKSADSYF